MDQHIPEVMDERDYYTFYGIERIGVASGRKYFGTIDWYQAGADASCTIREKKAVGTEPGAKSPAPASPCCSSPAAARRS